MDNHADKPEVTAVQLLKEITLIAELEGLYPEGVPNEKAINLINRYISTELDSLRAKARDGEIKLWSPDQIIHEGKKYYGNGKFLTPKEEGFRKGATIVIDIATDLLLARDLEIERWKAEFMKADSERLLLRKAIQYYFSVLREARGEDWDKKPDHVLQELFKAMNH